MRVVKKEVSEIREISKTSTAQCNLEHYTLFLLSEPKHGSVVG